MNPPDDLSIAGHPNSVEVTQLHPFIAGVKALGSPGAASRSETPKRLRGRLYSSRFE